MESSQALTDACDPRSRTIAKQRCRTKKRPQRQRRYHVVLWNDNDHTYAYVIHMLGKLFGYPGQRGLQLADEVHYCGRSIVLSTTKEHAELKRDQIHAYGRDQAIEHCRGSMSATIEAENY